MRLSTLAALFLTPFLTPVSAEAWPKKKAAAQQGECPAIVLSFSYTPLYPEPSAVVKDEVRIELPNIAKLKKPETNDEAIYKSLFALKIIASYERALKKFDRTQSYVPWPWFKPNYRPMLDGIGLPALTGQQYETAADEAAKAEALDEGGAAILPPTNPRRRQPKPTPEAITRNKQLAAMFRAEMAAFAGYANGNAAISGDPKLMGLIDLGNKLADNMDKWEPYHFGGWGGATRGGGMLELSFAPAGAKSLNITAGGAQDAGHFRSIIEKGDVPEEKQFVPDGLLRELSLSIPVNTEHLIAVAPHYLVDPKEQVVYVQMDMGSRINESNFKRNPADVSLLMDISGSMGATDGTEAQRIEWAKHSIITMIRKLTDQDTVSISLFDEATYVLLEPTLVSELDIPALEKRIEKEVKLQGGTDIEKALKQGVAHARKQQAAKVPGRDPKATVENRIILVSDAGHNTGGTEAGIIKTVNDAARDGIAITAIGLGLNFNSNLVQAFSDSTGGNALFVQNGEQMHKLFDNFDYLIQPIARDYRVAVEMENLPDGSIERAWGMNVPAGAQTTRLPTVSTLFFAGPEGGGAMVLAIRYGASTGPSLPPAVVTLPKPEDDRSGPSLPGRRP